MSRYYLKPIESQNQKGFGHNAEVEVRKDGTKVLYSYLRKMAKITPNGSLVRLVGHGKEKYKGKMKSLCGVLRGEWTACNHEEGVE